MADTACVPDNASMGILKNKATAQARANIAQQIQVNVQAMDKTYQSLTENGEQESGSGQTFESVSKQVTNQMLQGAIPKRVDYIPGRSEEDGDRLCVMVVLAPEQNRKVFENIIEASNRRLTPDNEALMYQEYRAKQAQEELEQTTE
ncbi:LPP20 family lipoprotein [Salicola sp. Rm-C-2C1-2]|uniref:LPP20 family lipoprotein n=1 Tax=Salicola sp. Rm-C-2C1-2 TaxID=3141321 RepID=UPI0032E36C05